MKTEKELYEQYKAVPGSLKALKRWICWSKESIGGDIRKVPINPISGGHAKSNEPVTWSTFEVSVKGCVKYNCAGLGFMLGNGITGVDIDNHPDKKTGARPMTDEQFKALCGEFVSQLDSYSEISQSGEGVHIICYASLPEGSRHGANVEMYDTGRFFAFTGNVIRSIDVQRRDAEIISLWKKYVDNTRHASAEEPEGIFVSTGEKGYHFRYVAGDGAAKAPQAGEAPSQPSGAGNGLSDEEIIRRASQSAEGADFMSYYSEGKILHPEGMKDTSHSAADQSFACMLAFWCNKDAAQMDRIFRSSALMRDKWDEMRGRDTYGHIVIANAVRFVSDGYRPEPPGREPPPPAESPSRRSRRTAASSTASP
jgi:putative DNA primase/helicase